MVARPRADDAGRSLKRAQNTADTALGANAPDAMPNIFGREGHFGAIQHGEDLIGERLHAASGR
jgi:hypothetical protein